MSRFLIGILGTLMAASQLGAATNLVQQGTNGPATATESKEQVEKAYQKLLDDDDAAQQEVDRWIRDNNEFAAKGAGVPRADLNRRIRERFEPIRKAYEDFLLRHPDHVRAHLAFGGFLSDLHEEDAAREQWEKALALDPRNPAAYNNLANVYTHDGPVQKAFEYYTKAIELSPREPLYYHNLSDVVYSYRKDAKEFYGLTNDQQVFRKALELYRQASEIEPQNFPFASDVAQTYYALKPLPTEEALKAWTNALRIAHDELEREGVYLHLARVKLAAGRFAEARAQLNAVTEATYTDLKARLLRNLNQQEQEAKGTNTPPTVSDAGQQTNKPGLDLKIQTPK